MRVILLLIFISFTSVGAFSQNFVYRPVNPSFGGDTFNYNWLLSSAQIQDKIKDPNAVSSKVQKESQLSDFSASLNNQLLNSISKQLFSNRFGENGLKEGTYQYGDLTVDVSPGTEGLIVRISDGKGGETLITVPYY